MVNIPVQTAVPSSGKNISEIFSVFLEKVKIWYTSLSSSQKNIVLGVSISMFAILFIGLNIVAFQYGQRFMRRTGDNITVTGPTPTPTPTPIPFKNKGKMDFSVSTSGSVPGPKVIACTINPLDFSTTKMQTFQMTITSTTPVATASVGWRTDNEEHEVPLTLISGTPTKGVWEGKKQVTDTAWYRYELIMKATDGTNKREITLTLR